MHPRESEAVENFRRHYIFDLQWAIDGMVAMLHSGLLLAGENGLGGVGFFGGNSCFYRKYQHLPAM